MTDAVVQSAIPSLIAVLNAIQEFNKNIGPDPAQWPLRVPGAFTVLLGEVQMQIPALALAEGGALESDINAKLDQWKAQLQAPTRKLWITTSASSIEPSEACASTTSVTKLEPAAT